MKLGKILLICALAVVFSVKGAVIAPDAGKIEAVKSGKVTEARASWWGFDPADSTAMLQQAIDSGVRKLVIDNTGGEWRTLPLKLRSDLELVLADGVVLRAKPDAFQGLNDSLLEAVKVKNLIIRGEGKAEIRMNRQDYRDTARYKHSEWRHTLSLRSSENIQIRDITIAESGGDGIYIGRTNGGNALAGCRDITIENVICAGHLRQGISVISAENLLIRNSKFIRTGGTPPAAGIDYEPNYPDEFLVNCVAENCDFSENQGSGIEFFLANLTGDSRPVSIEFRNCRSVGNRKNVAVLLTTYGLSLSRTPFTGKIVFDGLDIGSATEQEIYLSGLRGDALDLTFNKAAVNNDRTRKPAILLRGETTDAVAGLKLNEITVTDHVAKLAPVRFDPGMGSYLGEVSGKVRTRFQGRETSFDLQGWVKAHPQSEEAKNFRAAALPDLSKLGRTTDKAVEVTGQEGLRQKFTFLQYAKAGEAVVLSFKTAQVNRNPQRLSVSVIAPDGQTVDSFKLKENEWERRYELNPALTGVYRFNIDTGLNTVRIDGNRAGRGYSVAKELALLNTGGRLYFAVPAGTGRITVRAAGSPNEEAAVELLDPSGKVVASKKGIIGKSFVSFPRPPGGKAEIWSIRFDCKKLFVDVDEPLVPIFYESPELLLK